MPTKLPLLCAMSAALGLAGPNQASAQIVLGQAEAVDGDSLEMTGTSIRLFGVDAPEALQTCQRGGETWACGQEAKAALAQLTQGKPLRCETRDHDKYGRSVATCYVGRVDLAATMVAAGLAVALPDFTTTYVEHEARARWS